MKYNFSRLSSLDFEELIRDLLTAHWHVQLESFKSGRDGGIDLRHISVADGKTIVQCKEYSGSGFSKLRSQLKLKELPKIRFLSPDRYVLVTSVGLTPDNKDDLVELLAPFAKREDIIGGTELEGLLRDYPAIETRHYKLWLTSTAVLNRVIHAAEQCQTDLQLDRIRRKLPIFVQNNAYPRAMKILEEERVVVISGAPGIGKSTLAEMLIYAHLNEEYEPVVIKTDLAEGRKFYRPDHKFLFYFDDFLGQTYLGDRPEYLGRNQDAALADFIELIRNSERARFILTTREHILGGALERSERLAQSQLANHKCVIELADYRRSQKARILYNHLYFSELPAPYKGAIVANDFFLNVIDHPNFSPRVIEWLSSFNRLKGVSLDVYQKHVKQLLDEPERIWSHAFNTEISNAARAVLLATYTVGYLAEIDDVEAAFSVLHSQSCARYNYASSPIDFRTAMKELDGSFINIRKGQVEFINPSVRDFLGAVLAESRDRVRDVVCAAVRYRQIASMWELAGRDSRYRAIKEHLLFCSTEFVANLTRLIPGEYMRWRKTAHRTSGTYVDYSHLNRATFAMEIADELKSDEAAALANEAFGYYFEVAEKRWVDVAELVKSLELFSSGKWFFDRGGETARAKLLTLVLGQLDDARSTEWEAILEIPELLLSEEQQAEIDSALEKYRTDGVTDERFDCSTVEELESLRETLEKFEKKYGVDFDRTLERLNEDIAEKTAPEPDDDEGRSHYKPAYQDSERTATDAEVREIFSSLIDRD